ncbi:endo-1,4-beta-xylanase [Thermophagus xiamenensis]|jgi:endo-1,4-beta-xylanase|uniref:Endo-1,4-beta-xylanase n=1 Tax=Thermophagus xiamenensis TaxID=385682 RepID=A0A1I1VZK7_9BACT|nr:endo-1,4-beta-xylanase [Thermophagus xiamenensis]
MLQPRKGKINFDLADQFVKFGEENKMLIVGYLLVWHSQTARWFFDDEVGNDVSKEVFIERMKTHNHTVISCN